jgi:hypothetical protein
MITGMAESQNVAHARRALEDQGAVVSEILYGAKHITLRFSTKCGVRSALRVPYGQITDRYKFRGWARQAVTRAVAREHVLAQGR